MPTTASADLLALAETVLSGSEGLPPEGWQHSCALLARQALEAALDELWSHLAPDLAHRPTHYQLLCLPFYLGDAPSAGRVSHLWASLSNASRHHSYEVAPAAVELRGWLQDVADVRAALQPGTVGHPPAPRWSLARVTDTVAARRG
jgi:hypothetical protein